MPSLASDEPIIVMSYIALFLRVCVYVSRVNAGYNDVHCYMSFVYLFFCMCDFPTQKKNKHPKCIFCVHNTNLKNKIKKDQNNTQKKNLPANTCCPSGENVALPVVVELL